MGSKETFGGIVLTGPCAGQFHRCQSPYLHLFDPEPAHFFVRENLRLERLKTHSYHWFPIEIKTGDGRGNSHLEVDTGVWAPENWTLADVIRELMEGYKRP